MIKALDKKGPHAGKFSVKYKDDPNWWTVGEVSKRQKVCDFAMDATRVCGVGRQSGINNTDSWTKCSQQRPRRRRKLCNPNPKVNGSRTRGHALNDTGNTIIQN